MNITNRRINLIARLIKRTNNDNECSIYVKDAVKEIVSEIYCNTKFDPYILLDILTSDGWTEADIKYFGLADIFDETKGE